MSLCPTEKETAELIKILNGINLECEALARIIYQNVAFTDPEFN